MRFSIILLLIIFSFLFQKEIKIFFYSISLPIQETFWGTGLKASGFLEAIFSSGQLKKERDELSLEVQRLLAEEARLKNLEEENKTLREALGLGLEKDFTLVFARVAGKEINQDVIFLDQGASAGLKKDMPVITSQKALVGKIAEIYPGFSKVMLISHPESLFEARLLNQDTLGILKGRGGSEVDFDLMPEGAQVSEGEIVISSALMKIYPAGLPIGFTGKIQKSDTAPFLRAQLVPLANIANLEQVFIIVDF